MLLALGLAVAGAAAVAPASDPIEVHFAPTGRARLLEAGLAEEIGRARREIRVALFLFTSRRLAAALGRARARGVRVRVLLDASVADADFVADLRRSGVEVRRVVMDGEDPARFHHKYSVMDTNVVTTGSYNWTVRGDTANHENLVILRDAAVARAYGEDFERTWNDAQRSRR